MPNSPTCPAKRISISIRMVWDCRSRRRCIRSRGRKLKPRRNRATVLIDKISRKFLRDLVFFSCQRNLLRYVKILILYGVPVRVFYEHPRLVAEPFGPDRRHSDLRPYPAYDPGRPSLLPANIKRSLLCLEGRKPAHPPDNSAGAARRLFRPYREIAGRFAPDIFHRHFRRSIQTNRPGGECRGLRRRPRAWPPIRHPPLND